MRSTVPCSVLLSMWLPACAATDDDIARAASGIFHGAVERGEPAVVAVHHPRPGATTIRLCTGAVIAPRVVLTAKHCVFDDVGADEWAPVAASALTIAIGHDLVSGDGIESEHGVRAIDTTPGPYTRDDALYGNDVALLHLDSDLAVPALPVARSAASIGSTIRIVGFGLTESDELGVKHTATTTVTSVGDAVLESEGASWTCTGDSGGPAIDVTSGAIVGVTSIGPRGCSTSTSYYTRADAHLTLIDTALGVAPPPPAPPAPPPTPTPGTPPTPTPGTPPPPSSSPDAGTPAVGPGAPSAGSKADGCSVARAPGADERPCLGAWALFGCFLSAWFVSRRRRDPRASRAVVRHPRGRDWPTGAMP